MTTLNRNPSNPNLLHPNKFILSFDRLPNMQYFCQGVSVPGLSLSEVPRNTPFIDVFSPGEKLIYDLLNVTFYVDEELKSWKEIHDWIRAMTFPTEFEEYVRLGKLSRGYATPDKPQFSDASLTLLSSSNTPYYRFKFVDCFPITLTSFVVSSTDTPESVITSDVTFRFAYYNIEKLF